MKKTLISVLTLAIVAASLPITALAADHSDPVTRFNGERLKYNTPYYLKDKNLPHKGGVTFETWALYDYVLFADSFTDNGTPIIFENEDRTDGFIKSQDKIRIKTTKANAGEYWTFTSGGFINSVSLSDDNNKKYRIYGSSEDNSIGIGFYITKPMTVGFGGLGSLDYPGLCFVEYKGTDAKKAWMEPIEHNLDNKEEIPFNNIQTPFEIIEVNE
ncbi:hypothetical protein CBR56_29380 [Bacillus thuringiensis]|uniref:hypothetical protein n=1 Tax=Bacillus tropicus TaxID=2026188 RepID=UPI000B455253|nr:hypothetical protein [Bacillus tropicus]MED3038058.1 hypothetical protein [Bacillus tropicus]OTX88859.1 hypothetical protein BK728_04640 [Bacillus thuringiensis serovar chanpaisis]PNK22383.1 hypothetical protein CBR56_29380 [Bacillus thuringiensis]